MPLKYRHIEEKDRPLLEKWVASDPDHSKTSNADFWVPPSDPKYQHKGVRYLAIEDELGAVIYARCENVLRLHLQFAPPAEKDRTKKALEEFALTIAQNSKQSYKEIIFESVYKPLIWFARKLGYRNSRDEYILHL